MHACVPPNRARTRAQRAAEGEAEKYGQERKGKEVVGKGDETR